MVKEINNWSLALCHDDLREFNSACLRGVVDGESVKTECLVGSDGVSSKRVKAADGTTYLMGDVDPAYRDYLRGYNPDWDENNFYWPMMMVVLLCKRRGR